jgi:hypothetical protein
MTFQKISWKKNPSSVSKTNLVLTSRREVKVTETISMIALLIASIILGQYWDTDKTYNNLLQRSYNIPLYYANAYVLHSPLSTTLRAKKPSFNQERYTGTENSFVIPQPVNKLFGQNYINSGHYNDRWQDSKKRMTTSKIRTYVSKTSLLMEPGNNSDESSNIRNDLDSILSRKTIATSFVTKKQEVVRTNNRKPNDGSNRQQQQPYRQNNNGYKQNNNRSNQNNLKQYNNMSTSNRYRQFNDRLVATETANELLTVLQNTNSALTQHAGGDALNSVNFSTSLHRLARRSTTSKSDRAAILVDPRFALLLASLAEALASSSMPSNSASTGTISTTTSPSSEASFNGGQVVFQSRELSNVAWALAKLQLAPPSSAMPMPDYYNIEDTTGRSKSTEAIVTSAQSIRQKVLEAARDRQQNQDSSSTVATWIPVLSQLAGQILDHIGTLVIAEAQEDDDDEDTVGITNNNRTKKRKPFRIQEWANLLWAWATSGRANSTIFGIVVRNMIRQQRQQQLNPTNDPTATIFPQEWSNSIWAVSSQTKIVKTFLS